MVCGAWWVLRVRLCTCFRHIKAHHGRCDAGPRAPRPPSLPPLPRSPRTVALYQMEQLSPTLTSPTTCADGAIHVVRATCGSFRPEWSTGFSCGTGGRGGPRWRGGGAGRGTFQPGALGASHIEKAAWGRAHGGGGSNALCAGLHRRKHAAAALDCVPASQLKFPVSGPEMAGSRPRPPRTVLLEAVDALQRGPQPLHCLPCLAQGETKPIQDGAHGCHPAGGLLARCPSPDHTGGGPAALVDDSTP